MTESPMVTMDVRYGVAFNLERVLYLSTEERRQTVLHEQQHLQAMSPQMTAAVRLQSWAALVALENGVAGPPLVEPDAKDVEIAHLRALLGRTVPFVAAALHHPSRYKESRALSNEIGQALRRKKS